MPPDSPDLPDLPDPLADGAAAEIAVVIVNYGTADLAAAAVASVLARDHGGRTVEVHLVDNASPGGDAARLAGTAAAQGWGGRVTLYPETVNHGFGRANNLVFAALAARATPPDMVFLLNPDARLANEAIAALAGLLEADPAVGGAGARIEKPRAGPDTGPDTGPDAGPDADPDTDPVTAAFRFPSVASEFGDSIAFGPVSRLFARHAVPLAPDHPAGPVDWVAGAAVMLRFAAVRAVGGFDPAYFLYYEEVDLMRRMAAAGWPMWYWPAARVVHAEGAATGVGSAEVTRRRRPGYWYDSWRIYFRNTHGRGGALVCALARLAGWSLNWALCRARGHSPGSPLHFFRDFGQGALLPLFDPRGPGGAVRAATTDAGAGNSGIAGGTIGGERPGD